MPTAKLGDMQLYYKASGEGDPLLFIHGLGSSTRDWENQAPYFSDRYRVVTPDLRGHGKSDKPPGPYNISLFANDIAELVSLLQTRAIDYAFLFRSMAEEHHLKTIRLPKNINLSSSAAIEFGCMPRSNRRCTASMASFAWIVASTR